MLRKAIQGFLLASMISMSGLVLADGDPTLHQVYQAAEAGKLNEAQGMMEKVLKDHPNSAKAHFVEAEILVKQGRSGNAEVELNTAERLEPGLPFAKPQSVQELKSRIALAHQGQRNLASGNVISTSGASGFPWGLLMLGIGSIVVITLIMRAITSRNAAPTAGNYQMGPTGMAGQPNAGGQPYAFGGGSAPMAPAGGGIGSSIASGLATGVAVGAGMVAGEALAHHFMDGNRGGNNSPMPVADNWDSSSDNMGGQDFGIAGNSSWDDNANVADSMDVGGGDDWS